MVCGLHHLLQLNNIFVLQHLHHRNLALELLFHSLLLQLLLVDDLDRPSFPGLTIRSNLHLGKVTTSKSLPELVLTNLLSH